MKTKVFCSHFIAISALSLCLGIPGQARAADKGGCDGRNAIHHKREDLHDYIASFLKVGKFRKSHDCKATQTATKPFVAPTSQAAQNSVVELGTAPAIESNMDVTRLAPVSVHLTRPSKVYEVVLNIPAATASSNGVVPAIYPAVFLKNQKKDGTWQKRHKMVAQMTQKANGDYICHLVFRNAPSKNSAVAIDFENGNSFLVTSDLLAQGGVTQLSIPKAAKKKKYRALESAYATRENRVLSTLRFIAPTALHAGIGFAMMGPAGLISAPVSLASSIAAKKLSGNQQKLAQLANPPPLHVQYAIAGQAERIEALERTVERLSKELDANRQTTKPTKTAKSEKR